MLLTSANGNAEKDHPDDVSLAGDGFDTVIKAKAAVDSNPQCRNKVSCADILALATREVIRLVYTIFRLYISFEFRFFCLLFSTNNSPYHFLLLIMCYKAKSNLIIYN